MPSRFPPKGGSTLTSPALSQNKSSRPTPATTPFKSSALTLSDIKDTGLNASTKTPTILTPRDTSVLLSRLRAGSMPQRSNFMDSSSPFGSAFFASSWSNRRDRASTLASVRSDPPESPVQSSFSKDGLNDVDVKTLDYLGLADTPRQDPAALMGQGLKMSIPPSLAPYLEVKQNPNRLRSYSVNAKEKYAAEEDEEYLNEESQTAAAYAETQYQIHQHNLAVQAYANSATLQRPRARTAGVLDSPMRSAGMGFVKSPLGKSIGAGGLGFENGIDYTGLPEAVQALHLGASSARPTLDNSDENNQDVPTRALWLGNIPTSTTVSSLQAIFMAYGKIESTRVLIHKNCGFVNFETIESAAQAKFSLNGKEIFPGAGAIRIGYAKAPSSNSGTPINNSAYSSGSPEPYGNGQAERQDAQGKDATNGSRPTNGVHIQTAAALQVPELPGLRDAMLDIVPQFGATDQDCYNIANIIDAAVRFTNYVSEIPPPPEASQNRIHDAPKLREIRKHMENNAITSAEVEEIAMAMLPEIGELGSDYLGNTVVQQLFQVCNENIKHDLLIRIEPHLAEMGVHKNGTWAAQKIIGATRLSAQMDIIAKALRPYAVPLFLDQYGNYVLQGCLQFGPTYNSFVFESMISRMWDIAQGRFGARAMRACLESPHATKDQLRMLAASVALHSVQLATNANGALLLTWYLDTCTFPRRRVVLAPHLVPHLVHLCTHRVAYLTVLKVINQRNEPEARDILGKALFFSEDHKVLEDILSDQTSGTTLIYKIITTPYFDENVRLEIVANIKAVLTRLKVSPSQGYRRLMDEVGMPGKGGRADREHQGPSGHGSHQDRSRPSSSHNMHSGRRHLQETDRYANSQSFPNSAQRSAFPSPALVPMTSALDPNLTAYDQYNVAYVSNPLNPQYANVPFNGASRGVSPAGFYAGLQNYVSAPSQFDPMGLQRVQPQPQRPMHLNPDALMAGQGYAATQFPTVGQSGFPYNQLGFLPTAQQQQQQMAMNQQQYMRYQNTGQAGGHNGRQGGGQHGGHDGAQNGVHNGGQNGHKGRNGGQNGG